MRGAQIDGRFVLEAALDGWGLGEGWHATDLSGEHPSVMIKILPESPAGIPDFEVVAERLKRLRHSTVAAVLAAGRQGARPWVAIEAPEGDSLEHWISGLRSRQDRAELPTVAAIFDQVCQAIAAGHRMRSPDTVTHGGLTSASIRFSHRPRGAVDVSVLDFGLAAFAGARCIADHAHTLAPERSTPLDEATPPSDVFALCVLLAEMLSTRPRPGIDLPRALLALSNRGASAVEALGPLRGDVHPSVWEALAVGLRLLPEERYRDADRLRDAFRRVQWAPIPEARDAQRPRASSREGGPSRTLPEAAFLSPMASGAAGSTDAGIGLQSDLTPGSSSVVRALVAPPLVSAEVVRPASAPVTDRYRDARPTKLLPIVTAQTAFAPLGPAYADAADRTALVDVTALTPADDLQAEPTSLLVFDPDPRTGAPGPRAFTPGLDERTTTHTPLVDGIDEQTRVHTSASSDPRAAVDADAYTPPHAGPLTAAAGPPSLAGSPRSAAAWPGTQGVPPMYRATQTASPFPPVAQPVASSGREVWFAQAVAVVVVIASMATAVAAVYFRHDHHEATVATPDGSQTSSITIPPPLVAPPSPIALPLPTTVARVATHRVVVPPDRTTAPTDQPTQTPLAPASPSAHGTARAASSDPAIDAAIARQDWTTARALLTTALSLHPDRADDYARLGDVMLRTGDTAGAVVEYQSATRLAPHSLQYLHKLAGVLETRGDRTRAAATWQRALAINPGDTLAREHLSRLPSP